MLESVQARWQFVCDGCGTRREHGGPHLDVLIPSGEWRFVRVEIFVFPNIPLGKLDKHYCGKCYSEIATKLGVSWTGEQRKKRQTG